MPAGLIATGERGKREIQAAGAASLGVKNPASTSPAMTYSLKIYAAWMSV